MWINITDKGPYPAPHLKQSERPFRTWVPTVSIVPRKAFTNPNFVNNTSHCTRIPTDSLTKNYKQSQSPNLITSIKENCPKVIPHTDMKNGIMAVKDTTNHTGNQYLGDMQEKEIVSDQHQTDFVDESQVETDKMDFKLLNFKKLPLDNFDRCMLDKLDRSETKGRSRRTKMPSVCESEDSFIVFEGSDNESYDNDESSDEDSSSDSEYDSDESTSLQNQNDDISEVDSCHPLRNKLVQFAPDNSLCEVHPMIKWSFAYQAARKGPWEMYARDRSRFRDRINRVEKEIKYIFDLQHRNKIYKERFDSNVESV